MRPTPRAGERRYVYDSIGLLSKTIDAAGGETRFEYNEDGRLTRQLDPENKETRYEYDPEGRLFRTLDGNGNAITIEYARSASCTTCASGAAGEEPAKILYPTFSREFTYDKRGRKTRETEVLSAAEKLESRFTYDAAGNLLSRTDREGRISGYAYDPFNRLSRVTDALSKQTLYAYDSRNNLLALTDAEGNTTRFKYDKNNRLTREIRPLGQAAAYQYDPAGNLLSKLDAKGQKTAYEYDPAGRLIKIRYFTADNHNSPQKTVAFSYDKTGNLVSYTDGTTSAIYAYDALNRKIQETVNYSAFSLSHGYSYYKNGMKKTFTGPDGVTTGYAYDANNQLSSVEIPAVGSITYSTYNWSRPTEVLLPGGSKRQYAYDSLMRVKEILATDPLQNPLMHYRYSYDKMDNITEKATEHGGYAYSYDALYRLTAADNPSLPKEAYTYDGVGNRLTSTEHQNWSYNPNNELQGYNGITFQYDVNGNTIQKTENGAATNYRFNTEDRLTQVTDGAGSLISTYYYDPFGRRLWKEVAGVRIYFAYTDEGLVAEADAAGTVIKTYGYRPGSIWTTDPLFMRQGGQYYFYQNDHLGTPQKMTSISGPAVWEATYEAFGSAKILLQSAATNNMRFPGQYFDQEIVMHYNWLRYYHPRLGRYFRTDPIGIDHGRNHLYVYVLNSPVNSFDPSGLDFIAGAEAQRLLNEFKTWIGTPYKRGGSEKGENGGADCSHSTHQGYINSGFPYKYSATREFAENIMFRPSPGNIPQIGDVGLWTGHMAVYAGEGQIYTAHRPGSAPFSLESLTDWKRYNKV